MSFGRMQLNVLVIQATDIPRLGFLTSADPYVVLTCEHQTHMTKVIQNSQTPIWNEQFQFTLRNFSAASLTASIHNGDALFDNNQIAQITIPVKHLPIGQAHDQWFDIDGTNPTRLHLNLLMVPIPQFQAPSYATNPVFYHQNSFIPKPQMVPATLDLLPPLTVQPNRLVANQGPLLPPSQPTNLPYPPTLLPPARPTALDPRSMWA